MDTLKYIIGTMLGVIGFIVAVFLSIKMLIVLGFEVILYLIGIFLSIFACLVGCAISEVYK